MISPLRFVFVGWVKIKKRGGGDETPSPFDTVMMLVMKFYSAVTSISTESVTAGSSDESSVTRTSSAEMLQFPAPTPVMRPVEALTVATFASLDAKTTL